MDGVALTVFQIIQNGVVAELIPAAHKLFQPENALLLLMIWNTDVYKRQASFHPFPTVIFLDFQSSFQYPNGLFFTIPNKTGLFSPYSCLLYTSG